jgi:SAM-dependent methyltransferase
MENRIRFNILSPFSSFLARQLAHPSGWIGRVVMTRALNRRNRALISATLDALALTEKTKLLDVGFGGGLSLRLARAQGVRSLSGIDPSIAAVDQLKKTSSRWLCGADLTVTNGVVEHLPYEQGSFDAILSTNTVYFWVDLAAAFRELHRVLAAGGRLAVGFSSSERLRSIKAVTRHGFLFHENDELLSGARQGGFADAQLVALRGHDSQGNFVLVATSAV